MKKETMIEKKGIGNNWEKHLYVLICIFAIISSFTVLFDSFNLRAISKSFQALILILCFILNFNNKINPSSKNIVRILNTLIVFLFVLFIKDIFLCDIGLSYIFRNFLQIYFMYFWLLIAFSISELLLDKILEFIQKLFYLGMIFSVLELLIPIGIKEYILSFILGGIPGGYLSRDVQWGFMRLGSFYFSPLTYSFTLLFLLCYYKITKSNAKSWFTYIIAFLAQTKTAILGGILFLFGKNSKTINNVIFYSTLIFVIFICTSFDGWFFYYAFDSTPLKSLANHLSGLVFGVQEGFVNLWGNGLGKSGYLVFLDSKTDPSLSNLYEITEFETGNESVYGVIGYQLGGIFLILHFVLFYKLFRFQMGNKNYTIASFILLIVLFQYFSESPLTVLVTFCQAFLFAKGPVKDSSVKNIQNEDSNY